jgi:hypothetical protein
MEESPTPFLIADAFDASGMAVRWAWVLLGVLIVSLGALAFTP